VVREGAGGRGGEMTQTLYVHMKKILKKDCFLKSLPSLLLSFIFYFSKLFLTHVILPFFILFHSQHTDTKSIISLTLCMIFLTFLSSCIGYFSHLCDKIPDINNLREGFISAHSFRGVRVCHGGKGLAEQSGSHHGSQEGKAARERHSPQEHTLSDILSPTRPTSTYHHLLLMLS
jgi:hypothetical protein